MSKSHLTAKGRKSVSRPMRMLNEMGLLVGRMLDYGCGRGFDADHFGMDSFDPYYKNVSLVGKYDTITCNYVLNVIEGDLVEILSRLRSLLVDGGTCYITAGAGTGGAGPDAVS